MSELPSHPNLEFLKKQAKARLATLRQTSPSARLADAQHAIADEYGFASWAALKAHLDLAARESLAMHFGTFQLTPEGIDDPPRELAKALHERGVSAERFRTVAVGESVWLGRHQTR